MCLRIVETRCCSAASSGLLFHDRNLVRRCARRDAQPKTTLRHLGALPARHGNPCRDITAPHSAFAVRRYFHSARNFYHVALLRTTGSAENHHIALKRVFLRQRVKCVDGRPLSAPMNGKGRIASVGLGPLRDITPTPPRGEHPNRRLWHQSGRGRHAA